MYHGSTPMLREKDNPKQPCLFFLLSDALVVIRPPVGSITVSYNEANNIRAMTMVYQHALMLLEKLPDITSSNFASTMGHLEDGSGKKIQTEAIALTDIVSAHVSKAGLLGAKITIEITGKPALLLIADKKSVAAFGALLIGPLGSRLTGSVRTK